MLQVQNDDRCDYRNKVKGINIRFTLTNYLIYLISFYLGYKPSFDLKPIDGVTTICLFLGRWVISNGFLSETKRER